MIWKKNFICAGETELALDDLEKAYQLNLQLLKIANRKEQTESNPENEHENEDLKFVERTLLCKKKIEQDS